MRKNVYKSERYGKIEGYGKPLVIIVDFPVGAAVSQTGWSVWYGSPFCYNDNLMRTAVDLFKDITEAKVCRYDFDLHSKLYDDFKTNLTMVSRWETLNQIPTHNTKKEVVDKMAKILSRHPFIIQSMGRKTTMVIRFTLNEPLRINGKTYDKVYNYMDKVWLESYDFSSIGDYGLEKIVAWDGILDGNTEKANSRIARMPIQKG